MSGQGEKQDAEGTMLSSFRFFLGGRCVRHERQREDPWGKNCPGRPAANAGHALVFVEEDEFVHVDEIKNVRETAIFDSRSSMPTDGSAKRSSQQPAFIVVAPIPPSIYFRRRKTAGLEPRRQTSSCRSHPNHHPARQPVDIPWTRERVCHEYSICHRWHATCLLRTAASPGCCCSAQWARRPRTCIHTPSLPVS